MAAAVARHAAARYVVVTDVNPYRLELAKRMGAKTIEVAASHLALISHPDAITDLILQALAV